MSALRSLLFVLAALPVVPPCLHAGIQATFSDVEEFRDFTIHGLFQEDDAKLLFEKQLQIYWKRRMSELVPQGTTIELHFNDIDMAGEMQPWYNGPQAHVRVIKSIFPPRLEFQYTITDRDGQVLYEGQANLLGKDFGFRLRRKPTADDITFFYEFEMIYRWLDSLERLNAEAGN